jgi:signal recognition particle GTPase
VREKRETEKEREKGREKEKEREKGRERERERKKEKEREREKEREKEKERERERDREMESRVPFFVRVLTIPLAIHSLRLPLVVLHSTWTEMMTSEIFSSTADRLFSLIVDCYNNILKTRYPFDFFMRRNFKSIF